MKPSKFAVGDRVRRYAKGPCGNVVHVGHDYLMVQSADSPNAVYCDFKDFEFKKLVKKKRLERWAVVDRADEFCYLGKEEPTSKEVAGYDNDYPASAPHRVVKIGEVKK
jgi:hypothetical protein